MINRAQGLRYDVLAIQGEKYALEALSHSVTPWLTYLIFKKRASSILLGLTISRGFLAQPGSFSSV